MTDEKNPDQDQPATSTPESADAPSPDAPGGPKSYRKANLKGENFRDQDLRGADFHKANLRGADFTGADVSGADFTGANLGKATLENVNAAGAIFVEASLEKATIKELDATGADFSRASLKDMEIVDLKATDANFAKATVAKVHIKNAHFEKTNFQEADWHRMRIEDARFVDVSMAGLKSPNMRVDRCTFERLDATGADLLSLYATQSEFTDCNFTTADISGVGSHGARWIRCNFTKAELTAGEFKESELTECVYDKANARYAAGLTEEQLAEIKQGGGKVSRYLLRRFFKWLLGTNVGRIVFVAVIVIASLISVAQSRNPYNWSEEKLWSRAQEADAEDRLMDAVEYYNVLSEKIPRTSDRYANVRLALAQILFRLDKFDDAKQIVEDLLADELIPQYSRVQGLTLLAETEIRQNNFDNIKSYVQRILDTKDAGDSLVNSIQSITGSLVPKRKNDLVDWIFEVSLSELGEDPGVRSDLLFARAQARMGQQKYEEAIADFKSLEELELADNKEQQLLLGLANAYRRVGDEANADKYFKELATKFPDAQDQVTRAKFDLAMTLRGQGKFDEAEKLLRQAIDDAVGAEQKSQAIGELATLMLDSGRTDEGLKLLNDELQNLAPGSQLWAEFQIKIAAQNQYRGQNEEAVRILENVTKYELDNSVNQWARTALMDAYASINRVDQAIEQAKIVQTLTDDPMIITTTQMNLAQLYWRDGKNEEALAILEDLSKTGHTDDQKAQAVTMRMELLQQAGRRDDAVAVARSVISENELPRLVLAARVQLAEIYNNEGNNGEAKKVLEEVLTEPLPDDLPGNFMRLPGLSNTDELRETILNIFQKLVDKLAPGEGDQAYTYWLARMTVGMIDDQMGETDKAVRELSEAFAKASDPNLRLQAGESLGQTYTRAEQLDEAEAVYTKIGETWPDRSDAQVTSLIGLGTVARRARNFDRAEETYQKALGMCNTDPMLCCRIQGERLQAFRESNQAEKIREVYRAVLDGLPDCWLREEALQALKPEAPAEGGEGG